MTFTRCQVFFYDFLEDEPRPGRGDMTEDEQPVVDSKDSLASSGDWQTVQSEIQMNYEKLQRSLSQVKENTCLH